MNETIRKQVAKDAKKAEEEINDVIGLLRAAYFDIETVEQTAMALKDAKRQLGWIILRLEREWLAQALEADHETV